MKKNLILIIPVLTTPLYTAEIEIQRKITDGPYKGKTAIILDNAKLTPSHLQDQECLDIVLKRLASITSEEKIKQFKNLNLEKNPTKKELFETLSEKLKKGPISFCLIGNERHFIDSQFLKEKS